jgi:hypothetical protein
MCPMRKVPSRGGLRTGVGVSTWTCHMASGKELPVLDEGWSLREAVAFQLSEQETLAKVEVVAHFSGTSWGGPPTAHRA